jgi:hypothetical protein
VVVRLCLSPWQTVKYEELPSLGKFEGDRFDPRTWRPQTPTAAYMELKDDDAFWAALRIAAFTNEMIKAIVHTGEFSDPAVEKVLADIMIKRRDKILRTYLPAVNPIVSSRFDGQQLTFENAAVAADVAKAPESYQAVWFEYDNPTGNIRFLSDSTSATTTIEAPVGLPTSEGSFIAVDISASSKGTRGLAKADPDVLSAHRRRLAACWLERIPDRGSMDRASR